VLVELLVPGGDSLCGGCPAGTCSSVWP